MTEKEKKLLAFYTDYKNWRPPSYTQIMAHMGWRSKNGVSKYLKRLNLIKQDDVTL